MPARCLRLVILGALLSGSAALAAPQSAQPARAPGRPDAPAAAARPPLLGDHPDGSRARPVHVIPLRDAEGEVVRPTDLPLLPFSPGATCGAECHDVGSISRGLHFSATARRPQGRPGEPWILADADTATQLPLSYHGWPGTFHPDRVGLTPWKFAKLFGGRTPGGLAGDGEPSAALKTRWTVSGALDVNCLVCHDASPAYDHAEYGRQVALENFRWAAAGASGLAVVTGAAKEMPNTFDYLFPYVEDALQPRMPGVEYAPQRFLPGAKVAFDIVREVPARRCYLCHSNADVEQTGRARWKAEQDIHLARGLTCVDCHRNGLDHAMTRGEESGAAAASTDVSASCRGCHLASEGEGVFARGRLGAPYPRHDGLPPIHLQRLACTTCHSGPVPSAAARQFKTSQAHRLGGLNVNKAAEALPHLYYPVFVRGEDGTTRASRMMWPAFWGRLSNGTVTPLSPDHVKAVMARGHVKLPASPSGDWPQVEPTAVTKTLGLLAAESRADGTPVYVSGGRLHRVDATGRLTTEEHPAARPYVWPLAHDVRPAALALGAKGCQDCHDATGPIFAGRVPVDSPLAAERKEAWPMSRFQKGLDATYLADFARTFPYRPWLKGTVGASVAVLFLFALAYVLPAAARVSAATGAARWKRAVVSILGLAACSVTLVSGLPALLSNGSLTGYRLLLHVGSAPVFTVAAAFVALFWAERNRLARADWNRVRRPFGAATRHGAERWLVVLRKASFWVALVATGPAAVTATLAMFPVLASVRQPALFAAHRAAVWPLGVSAALFAVFAFLAWIQALWLRRKVAAPVPERT